MVNLTPAMLYLISVVIQHLKILLYINFSLVKELEILVLVILKLKIFLAKSNIRIIGGNIKNLSLAKDTENILLNGCNISSVLLGEKMTNIFCKLHICQISRDQRFAYCKLWSFKSI